MRTRTVLATTAAVVLAAALTPPLIRVAHRSNVDGVDVARLTSQLESLRLPDGRIVPPVARGEDSLESTGWSWVTVGLTGQGRRVAATRAINLDAMVKLRDGNGDSDDVWETFYIAAASHYSGTAPTPGLQRRLVADLVSRRSPRGFFAEKDIPRRTADPAHRVMATWAAVNALTWLDAGREAARSAPWLRSATRSCIGNTFVVGHAARALAVLRPGTEVGLATARCAGPEGVGVTDVVPPTNEEQLLALHGRALAAARDTSRAALAAALEPRPDWASDPWWTGHAVQAYVDAGGDPARYAPLAGLVADRLDRRGIAAAFVVPTGSMESDYDLVRVASLLGLPADRFVSSEALHQRAADEGPSWSGVDWSMWILAMKALGADIPQPARATLQKSVAECSATVVNPASFRGVDLCLRAEAGLGQRSQTPTWSNQGWTGTADEAIVQCAAVLPGCADQTPVRVRLAAALDALTARPDVTPTPILAALPAAAQAAGRPLSGEDLATVTTELKRRRGPEGTDTFYRLARTSNVIDFHSTVAAYTLTARSQDGSQP